MSEEERETMVMMPEPDVVGTSLAPQLGSDQADLDRGQSDMRRLSVLSVEEIPLVLYAKLRGRKSRVWRVFYDEYLSLKTSVGGRGRRDIIRMEQVSKGGAVSVGEEIREPGWFGRNISNRDWERRQRESIGEQT